MNYYNEFDPGAAAILRELIADGLIPPGDVDERSITDVAPVDLAGYRQCHFFAGVAGWSRALELAGWPDDRPVWTGSCPCAPFSIAGAGGGNDDPRSLWWAFRWLIDQCRPAVVYGEQVASRAGRGWLSAVRADLEAMGYVESGPPICALRASGRRTSGRGCIGWPTTAASDEKWRYSTAESAMRRISSGKQICLEAVAQFSGWPTAGARDWKDSPGMATEAKNPDGTDRSRLDQLPRVAHMAGWVSPTAQDHSRGSLPPRPTDTGVPLSQQAVMAGWAAPGANDGDTSTRTMAGAEAEAARKSWTNDLCTNALSVETTGPMRYTADGRMLTGSTAGMVSGGQLSAHMSRWLQGFPIEWCRAAMRIETKRRRR